MRKCVPDRPERLNQPFGVVLFVQRPHERLTLNADHAQHFQTFGFTLGTVLGHYEMNVQQPTLIQGEVEQFLQGFIFGIDSFSRSTLLDRRLASHV